MVIVEHLVRKYMLYNVIVYLEHYGLGFGIGCGVFCGLGTWGLGIWGLGEKAWGLGLRVL